MIWFAKVKSMSRSPLHWISPDALELHQGSGARGGVCDAGVHFGAGCGDGSGSGVLESVEIAGEHDGVE